MNAYSRKIILLITTVIFALLPTLLFAQGQAPAAAGPYDIIRYVLAGFAVLLLFVIVALGYAIKASLEIRKKQNARKTSKSTAIITSIMVLVLGFGSLTANAQDAAGVEVTPAPEGFWENLFATAPNDMLITLLVILVELFVIFGLVRIQIKLLKAAKPNVVVAEKAPFTIAQFLEKLGANKTTDDVESLDLNHDYDGIRELDNNIPKWWQLAFAGTILIGVIYLFRMFVTGTLLDQESELARDQRIAAIKMAEYLKNAANNIDENSVTMLDASGIAQGAEIYAKNCVACHGSAGEGGIGPNLTDEYWLHNGGVKDIFYSIKYGWAEKGMKAWKDDFSPMQIAQLTSYIKSLAGTNPPNAKEKEGELYQEESAS
jgi:cytochrome c oxidase cbb3-type subunit 3